MHCLLYLLHFLLHCLHYCLGNLGLNSSNALLWHSASLPESLSWYTPILGAESLSPYVQNLAQFAHVKEAKELHHFHYIYIYIKIKNKNFMKYYIENYKEFNRSTYPFRNHVPIQKIMLERVEFSLTHSGTMYPRL